MSVEAKPWAAKTGPRAGTLTVRVEGAFALELQHLGPLVIERINRHYGWACVGREAEAVEGVAERRLAHARHRERDLAAAHRVEGRAREQRPEPGTLTVRVEGAFALELQHLGPLVIERINRASRSPTISPQEARMSVEAKPWAAKTGPRDRSISSLKGFSVAAGAGFRERSPNDRPGGRGPEG
jgi:hypothetical protein